MTDQLIHHRLNANTRRGSAIVQVTVSSTVLLGFVALAVDVGHMYAARAEMQSAVDAAALAGTGVLLTDERLKGAYELESVIASARSAASEYAALNTVVGRHLEIDLNEGNSPNGGIVVGFLDDPRDRGAPLDLNNPFRFNSVYVRMVHDEDENGPLDLGFARIFGYDAANVAVQAMATAQDGVGGYRMPDTGEQPNVLPFALQYDVWLNLLATGPVEGQDNYSYDAATGEVSSGADWLPELNLYPGAGSDQLPPGNFGTVDIGSPNNSTRDIARQILNGISAEDLAWFENSELKLGSDGTLQLNGDTGLSAGIKDELAAIIGQPRAIPLFTVVSGPGNNAQFTIVGFAGVRIMDVKLTGAMSQKRVIIQPAVLADRAAIGGGGNSFFVYRPVALCR